MRKILVTANLESFYIKFLIPQLKEFKLNGYEIHIATKSENLDVPYVDKKIDVCFARSFNIKDNIKSFKQMKQLIKSEKYDIISCHTPFGGAITRLAAKSVKSKAKIVYMAHGFHFYQGAPIKNWLLFYFAEKYLAKYTDVLLTINSEDYKIAKSKFDSSVKFVNGVGLDSDKFNFKFSAKEKINLRESLGLNKTDFVVVYPAELSKRKRQIWLIKTIKDTFLERKDFHLLLPGKDSLKGKCQRLVKKYKLENKIHFLGFRNDIPKIIKISNLAVSSSKQEGLPVNIMEAVYNGLPIVATDCRGNRDLIKNGKNGFLINKNDRIEFVNKIMKIYKMNELQLEKIRAENKKIIKPYLLTEVIKDIMGVYK